MRLLLAADSPLPAGSAVGAAELTGLYAVPRLPWLRANFVSSLDGAATGADGRSGSLNNEVDGVVFELLRRLADVVVVGAGTARAEGYTRLADSTGRPLPLAVVSNSGRLPASVMTPVPGGGDVILLTRAAADAAGLRTARDALGTDAVLLCGDEAVDLHRAVDALASRGLTSMLAEGGPTLMADLLAAGLVDELDLTWVPALVGGGHRRITDGAPVDVAVQPMVLVEEAGTVLGRWRVVRD